MFSGRTNPEQDYARAAVVILRLTGLGVAFQQRWIELQITGAMLASREWAQLLASAQRAAEEIFAGTLPHPLGAPEPLTGRRRTSSRRARSIVINFPDRRTPAA